MSETAAYEGWALVEQMGFRKTVGKVREVEQFGTKMLRLDVPHFEDGKDEPVGYTTRFAGGPSLYQVSPLEEKLALYMARQQSDPRPVQPTAFRLASPEGEGCGQSGMHASLATMGDRPEEGDDDPVFFGDEEDAA